MRSIVTTLAIIFVLFAVPSFAAKPVESVRVLSTRRYIFYFKVEKQIIGGTVQIFDARQNLVKTESIVHAKTIVDFFELMAGKYTIKIKKGNEEFVFEYINIQ